MKSYAPDTRRFSKQAALEANRRARYALQQRQQQGALPRRTRQGKK